MHVRKKKLHYLTFIDHQLGNVSGGPLSLVSDYANRAVINSDLRDATEFWKVLTYHSFSLSLQLSIVYLFIFFFYYFIYKIFK